jgi:hypothetical protein
MYRPSAIVLLILLTIAPALAATGSHRGQVGDCPLVEPASAGDSGPARRPVDADGAAAAPATAARGEAPAATPRTRARWHSLLPGMIK